METTQLWCCIHGDWYTNATQIDHIGYCQPCWNRLQAWCGRQRRRGLPATTDVYREVMNLPLQRKPRRDAFTDCSVCYKHPRERGAFCKGCHNAYCQWSHKRCRAGIPAGGLDEFRLAVDRKDVVPKHEGEFHQGRVVRKI